MDITLRGGEPRAGSTADPCLLAAALSIVPAPEGNPIRLSVIIPTFNESENLPVLVQRVQAALSGAVEGDHELIVVDDDSPDRTWEVAQRLAAEVPELRVIRRRGEKGLSTAVIRGWQAARGEVLGVIDADLQHPPELLAALWQAMDGADLAVGSRHTGGGGLGRWSLVRRALSSGARLLALMMLPAAARRLTDPMSGCFMVRRSAIAGRPMSPVGYKILLEVLVRGAVRVVREVGYVFEVRRRGESKVTPRVYFDYLAHLLRLRLSRHGLLRFLRFCAVGLGGMLVDMTVLFVLGDPRALGLGLIFSKIVAAEVAMMSNFLCNDAFTFGDVAARAPGLARKASRFLRFNAVCGVGLAVQLLMLHSLTAGLGANRYAANAVTICLVAAFNYWLSLKLAWGGPAPARRREAQG